MYNQNLTTNTTPFNIVRSTQIKITKKYSIIK